jgi:hypothetical protein
MTNHEKILREIRAALEFRVASAIKIEREDLPVMSIGELLNFAFCLWGQTSSLGGYGATAGAIIQLIGEDLFWKRPEKELATPVIQ